jgi:hypothetical protein
MGGRKNNFSHMKVNLGGITICVGEKGRGEYMGCG